MDVRIVLFISVCCLICESSGQTSTDENDGQRCTTQDECPDGMCCVHNPLSKPEARKRFIFGQYLQHDHGFCRRARHFNESCWPLGHDANNPQLYEYFCPCDPGLECRGLVVHETNNQLVHKYPVCQYPESNLIDERPTASGPTCTTDSDCGSGMCCVLHPLSLKRETRHGYCRNEKKLNEACDLIEVNSHDFDCPCQAGLECRGSVVHHFGNLTVHEQTKCQAPVAG